MHRFRCVLVQASSRAERMLYNLRFRVVAYQLVALGALLGIGFVAFENASRTLAQQNIASGFGFLSREAGFVISQTFIDYRPTDTYGRALMAGIVNTTVVSTAAILLATAFGVVAGAVQLSSNRLLALLAQVYVNVLRGVPLLLLLFLCYAVIVMSLPPGRGAWEIVPGVLLTNGGLAIPAFHWTSAHAGVLLSIVLALGLAAAVRRRARAQRIETGQDRRGWLLVLLALSIPPAIAILVLHPEFIVSFPEQGRFRVTGGMRLTTEFTALLIALALSASAGIAETVRAGIQAIPGGQWEASKSLGLRSLQALRLVVLPQALRVVIPPLTGSYVSLFKNSSLAIAVGYPDLVMVANTTMNQTGQAIECVAIFMLTYLALSLAVAALMNWYNARTATAER